MKLEKNIQPMVHFAPEQCAFCYGNGTGRCRNGEIYERCPVCKGLGSVLVAQVSKKCPFCSGQGSGSCRDGYTYEICPVCKGSGWAYTYEDTDREAES